MEVLFRRLRRRPSTPLLAVLVRRLRTFDGARLARRAAAGEWVARCLGSTVEHPGGGSSHRTHWLFPIVVPQPAVVVESLRVHGVDASRATSSIAVVEAPAGRRAPDSASRMMSGAVFLPVYPELPGGVLDRVVGSSTVRVLASGRAGTDVSEVRGRALENSGTECSTCW
jgi:hypothetical protein